MYKQNMEAIEFSVQSAVTCIENYFLLYSIFCHFAFVQGSQQ